MKKSCDRTAAPQPQPEAVDEVAKTALLATSALDHPAIDDKELERLCDEALLGKDSPSKP